MAALQLVKYVFVICVFCLWLAALYNFVLNELTRNELCQFVDDGSQVVVSGWLWKIHFYELLFYSPKFSVIKDRIIILCFPLTMVGTVKINVFRERDRFRNDDKN